YQKAENKQNTKGQKPQKAEQTEVVEKADSQRRKQAARPKRKPAERRARRDKRPSVRVAEIGASTQQAADLTATAEGQSLAQPTPETTSRETAVKQNIDTSPAIEKPTVSAESMATQAARPAHANDSKPDIAIEAAIDTDNTGEHSQVIDNQPVGSESQSPENAEAAESGLSPQNKDKTSDSDIVVRKRSRRSPRHARSAGQKKKRPQEQDRQLALPEMHSAEGGVVTSMQNDATASTDNISDVDDSAMHSKPELTRTIDEGVASFDTKGAVLASAQVVSHSTEQAIEEQLQNYHWSFTSAPMANPVSIDLPPMSENHPIMSDSTRGLLTGIGDPAIIANAKSKASAPDTTPVSSIEE
ncbi:MAG: hypothetical protein AAGJ37_15745, partial [Pseudomonadota bacterium]